MIARLKTEHNRFARRRTYHIESLIIRGKTTDNFKGTVG